MKKGGDTMEKIIRGDLISKEIKAACQKSFANYYQQNKRKATLSVIMVGDSAPSMSYIRSKEQLCEYLDIKFELHLLGNDVSELEVIQLVKALNNNQEIDGIFIQMPLPKHINENNIILAMDYTKDVDGLHPMNLGNLILRKDCFIPCTPNGVMWILEELDLDLTGLKAVVLGRSILVGKPMAQLLEQANCTVTICHSKTVNLKAECQRADILVVGIGQAKMINKDYVKDGAIVIDIGINHDQNNKLLGDVDLEDVIDKVKYITPVPKGVGPMTVAMLACNILKAYKAHIGEQ